MLSRLLLRLAGCVLFLSPAFVSAQQPDAPDDVTIELPNNPVNDVLMLYERLTGKHLIRDSNLTGAPLTIMIPGKIPKADAIALLESSLLLNGYTLVPVDDKTVKVIGTGKSPLGESIPLYADAASLPSGEQVISYFMLFNYISTKDAMAVFEGYVALRTQGKIVAVPNSNAIVITDNTPLVRRLIALQRLIDIPGSKILTEFIPLIRADAEKVADTINQLLEQEQKEEGKRSAAAALAGQAAAVPPPPVQGQPPANPNQPPAAGGGALTQVNSPVQIVADVRTNRILVVAPENRMPYLRKLISELDVAVEFERPLEWPLRFAQAGEVLPVLQSILAEGEDETQQAATGGSSSNSGSNDPFSNSGGSSTGGSGGGSGSTPDRLTAPTRETAPLAVSVGKTKIIADRSANKILVIGPPESRAKAARVLEMLDQRPKQVYLATVIGQMTLGDGLEVGFDYLIKSQNFNPGGPFTGGGGLLRSRTAGADVLPDPSSLITNGALPILSGLTIYGTIAETVDIYAKFLQSNTKFKVISRPVVYTANNQKAVISSGQEVPVPTQSLSSVNNTGVVNPNDLSTSVTSNIAYKDVVLKLEVIPLINSNNEVTLNIAQQNNTILERVLVSNNEVPVIGKQELTTTITVKNRETIVLGGLITEEKQDQRTGIPLISSVPGLGYLFSTVKKSVTRRELIVLIQPLIINSPEDQAEANFIEKSMSGLQEEFYEDPIPVRRAEPVSPMTPLPPAWRAFPRRDNSTNSSPSDP